MYNQGGGLAALAQGAQFGAGIRQGRQRQEIGGLAAMGQYQQAAQKANEYGMLDVGAHFQGHVAQMDAQTRAKEAQTAQMMSQEALAIHSMTDPNAKNMAIADFGAKYGYAPDYIARAQQNPQLMMQVASGFGDYAKTLAANAENFTLSEGQKRFTGAGQEIAGIDKTFAPPSPTADMQNYEQALAGGFQGSFVDYQTQINASKRSPGVTVQTGNQGPQIGSIPAGYQAVQGADGSYSMAPIPGGPADEKSALGKQKAQGAIATIDRATSTTIGALDRALGMISNWSAGVGSVATPLPGYVARDLQAELDTVRANVAFNRLEEMRANSPTGGALGQVTERELDLLAAVEGALDQGQSPGQLSASLQRVRDSLVQVQQERRKVFSDQYGEAPAGRQEQKVLTYNPQTGGFD